MTRTPSLSYFKATDENFIYKKALNRNLNSFGFRSREKTDLKQHVGYLFVYILYVNIHSPCSLRDENDQNNDVEKNDSFN